MSVLALASAPKIVHDLVEGEHLGIDPAAVGLLVGEGVLDLVVEEHAPLVGVHEQHLAGPEAAGDEHGGRVHVEHAHLAREDQAVVGRHVVASGTQAVAVDGRSGHAAVRERDGCRAVPCLGEHGLVGIPCATLVGQVGVLVPRLGQHHGDGAREAAPVHGHELEHVIEHGRIGSLAVQDGQHALQVGAHDRGIQVRFPCSRPADVAAKGVDLAVVHDEAVGVRALPRRGRVRGIARVHERDRRFGGGVVEVAEEAAHLRGHEHALVDDGARAHGAHVEYAPRQAGVGRRGFLDGATTHVQEPLELFARLHAVGAAQERLADGGHARARRLAQIVRVNGHVPPEQQGHAAARAAFLEDPHRAFHALGVRGQEQHGHAVVPLGGQQVAAFLRLLAEESVGNLEEDARAVARVLLQAHAAAVLEVHEH